MAPVSVPCDDEAADVVRNVTNTAYIAASPPSTGLVLSGYGTWLSMMVKAADSLFNDPRSCGYNATSLLFRIWKVIVRPWSSWRSTGWPLMSIW
ncbi:MAG TPA: hypothetical protein VIT66_04890 [Lysobacter sp.]